LTGVNQSSPSVVHLNSNISIQPRIAPHHVSFHASLLLASLHYLTHIYDSSTSLATLFTTIHPTTITSTVLLTTTSTLNFNKTASLLYSGIPSPSTSPLNITYPTLNLSITSSLPSTTQEIEILSLSQPSTVILNTTTTMASDGMALASAGADQGMSNVNQTEQVSGAGAGKRRVVLGVLGVLVWSGVLAVLL
jgi:hypothetical protein